MGMYTECFVISQIKKDISKKDLDVLFFLFGGADEPAELPEHEFFKDKSWDLIGKGSSFYHIPFAMGKITNKDDCFMDYEYDNYYLVSRSDLKNYSDTIEKFFDWFNPLSNRSIGEMIGYKRYECDDAPTIIYKTALTEKGDKNENIKN